MKKKILFICGSMNITTQMQQIAQELPEYEKFFTPFYADGFIKFLNKLKLVEFTIIGENVLGNATVTLRHKNFLLTTAARSVIMI